jgi:hypothetical protein
VKGILSLKNDLQGKQGGKMGKTVLGDGIFHE